MPTSIQNADIKIVCANVEMIVSKTATNGKIVIEIDQEFLKALDMQNVDTGLQISFANWDSQNATKIVGENAFEIVTDFVLAGSDITQG